MKVCLSLFALLLTSSPAFALGKAPPPPPPCSIAVGITNRLGVFRTWTNALERNVLVAQKGFHVCDDDSGVSRTTNRRARRNEKVSRKASGCRTEFILTLRFKEDFLTRTAKIYRGEDLIYNEDFPFIPPEHAQASTKIFRTLPTCADLQKLATQTGK